VPRFARHFQPRLLLFRADVDHQLDIQAAGDPDQALQAGRVLAGLQAGDIGLMGAPRHPGYRRNTVQPMAHRADEFPSRVKAEIAAAVGHRCSMPDCRAPTSGPSVSQASGEAKAGVAAHIAAASPGGPRYDPAQRPQQRQSHDNAIWLCDTDARRIDTDEARYSRELLCAWRRTAEDRARAELGRPDAHAALERRRLVVHTIVIETPEQVGPGLEAFLTDIGAHRAWGNHFEPARMLLHELALNALEHGSASAVEVSSTPGSVTLREDGSPFSLAELRSSGEGGHRALRDFDADCVGSFCLQPHRDENENSWTLVDEVLSRGANTPCGLTLSEPRDALPVVAAARIEELANCEEIHLYPEPHWSYSDWFRLASTIGSRLDGQVLVVHGLSADSRVAQAIRERISQIRFAG
jgi:hypothetical protein